MNPDGSAHGYLRCNAGGQNLNREWCDSILPDGTVYKAPSLERSPEVYYVLKKVRGRRGGEGGREGGG
jgi:murein tripeptide amidase MpaA